VAVRPHPLPIGLPAKPIHSFPPRSPASFYNPSTTFSSNSDDETITNPASCSINREPNPTNPLIHLLLAERINGSGVRDRGKACSCAAAGGPRFRSDRNDKWWAPLLGWSGHPDCIDAQPAPPAPEERGTPAARRRGVLTEEKARQLRMRMMETESFHDAMYHSAIASRLASAAPNSDTKAS
jgi:hypothetical protein